MTRRQARRMQAQRRPTLADELAEDLPAFIFFALFVVALLMTPLVVSLAFGHG